MRYMDQTRSNNDEADESRYISNENAFIRYVTSLEPIPHIVETEFLKRNRRRVLFSGKIKSLSFFANPLSIQLNSCRRNNLALCEEAGLGNLADEIVFDSIDDSQMTRGTKGNLQNALITQKREFKDNTIDKKNNWFRGLVKRTEQEKSQQEVIY